MKLSNVHDLRGSDDLKRFGRSDLMLEIVKDQRREEEMVES